MRSLSFSLGNAKLPKHIAIFNLPAGYTCPGAKLCLAKVNPKTGKLSQPKNAKFRCYAASQEAAYPNVRKAHWRNLRLINSCKTTQEMADMICRDLPDTPICRIHESGDFFSEAYFVAWCEVARRLPNKIFYAYTKSLHYWARHRELIPSNLHLNASWGGIFDILIPNCKFKNVKVVFSKEEADNLGLIMDKTDAMAYSQSKDFALLLHGTQPANTAASKAWQIIRKTTGGYSRKTMEVK